MKAKLSLLLTAFALVLAITQSQPALPSSEQGVTPQQCSSFCARVRCIGGYVCGLYTNASGETVCGCHPR